MRFQVEGANRETGESLSFAIDAETLQDAERKAQDLGLLVSSVRPDASIQPSPPQQVQVHRADGPQIPQITIKTQQTRSNSLGIASLIIAILGFMICWIPFVSIISLPILGVAFLLGLIGLIMAIFRSGYGIGFPIASLTISVIGGVIAMVMGVGLIAGTSSALEEMAAAMEEGEAMTAIPLAASGSNPEPVAAEAGDAEEREEPEAEDWIPSSQAALLGDSEITIDAVAVGGVSITDMFGDEGLSTNPQLTIEVTVVNRSQGKKIEYKSWRGQDFSFGRDYASLTDSFENAYKRVGFGTGSYPTGGVQTSESIYPGDSVTDILVFEKPVDSVELLILELPAGNIGEKGVIRFGIRPADIQW